jgi:phosphotransferase system HPr (HPr) family protein
MTTAGPIRLTVRNPSGLHARPAALFVRTAGGFGARVQVANLTRGKPATDAKSILGVLSLGVSHGHEIELTADGDDAPAALTALKELIEAGLGEQPATDEPVGGSG